MLMLSLKVSALEIKNFKSGLVCTDGKTYTWLCHEVEKIYVTGQGSCTFNKETIPCTWHGISFDYKNMTKKSEISCKSSTTEKMKIGNPNEEESDEVKEYTYTLPVKLGEGHFFNPQFVGLYANAQAPFSTFAHTTCSAEGKVVFEFNKEFIYPKKP
jgi:hypothetical protein